ncbi:MAG TPA: hypothetical protein PL033_18795 [Candidatus Brocadiia bacterium]|nr:hypothetical protein [Candidatus Brocadiia bacterium]
MDRIAAILGATVVFAGMTSASAQYAQSAPGKDWLIDNSGFEAKVVEDGNKKRLILTNGLIRRVLSLKPDGATIAFDNLMTGESVIRGVKPEAIVEIDGTKISVGGLLGQEEYAYLRPEWIAGMTANPDGFRLAGHEIGRTKERFAWKRKRYCADLPWPPPGVSVRLDFKAHDAMLERLAKCGPLPVIEDRQRLLSLDLTSQAEGLKIHKTGKAGADVSFGKDGCSIKAPANTCTYVEAQLPKGTLVVTCRIDPKTDKAASWGPGLTLVWPDRTIKFNLRPGMRQLGVMDGGGESLYEKFQPGRAYLLRMSLAPGAIRCEASTGGGAWDLIHEIKLEKPLGDPIAVRIGKTSRNGGSDDFSDPEAAGECVVGSLIAYGETTQQAREEQLREIARLKAEQEERIKEFAWLRDITVSVHYELYDGIPLISKWIEIRNEGQRPHQLATFASEILAAVEYESSVGDKQHWRMPNLHVETDLAYLGMTPDTVNHAVKWVPDPQYTTQICYSLQMPCMLECRPPIGPDESIEPGATFESFRTFELLYDTTERERQGLSLRRMYRAIAPWVTENPILMHVRNADRNSVDLAIEQCAEVGFEMIIMTFGSGFDAENESEDYLMQLKEMADYAHRRGIELGGYSLLASRRISDKDDCINPATGKPGGMAFGDSPCLGSEWSQNYFRKLRNFFEKTGLDILEHDGSYPGDVCASTAHPGHKGLNDSQWKQWKVITDFYKWCRARGIYLNVPDWYFLTGSTKNGMGYREVNWSLPRDRQILLGRQNIYDGTWEKTPSMGWMFVPLVQYHGGGAAATLEPLAEHLDAYGAHLAQNFGSGVQACYRGPRLYDLAQTRDVVKKWVDFYKKYRAILDSDIIHVRRPDGRWIDCMMHVNPKLPQRGLAMVYNPTDAAIETTLTLPLYFTGLTDKASVREQEGGAKEYALDREYRIQVPVKVAAKGVTWLVIEE